MGDRALLEQQVADLQATVRAIGSGGVDAVVVRGKSGADVYTLTTADKPYRVILEEMGDGAVTLSRRGLVLYANRRFCEMTGLARSSLLGKDLRTLVAPASRALVTELLTLPAGDTRHLQVELGDGSSARTMQVAGTGIDQAGVPLTCAIFTDITEGHRTALLLAEAADLFSAAFDDAPMGMALVDDVGRMLRCNAVLMRLLGSPAEAAVGADLVAFFHPRDRSALRADLADLFAGRRGVVRRELRFAGPDGAPSWTSVSASLVRTRSGDQAVIHVEDISARKLYEDRLEVLADRDPLTGLFNRRRFREELERWLLSVDRSGAPGALMLLDLDNFKYVNDTLGHQVGDRFLQHVARVLSARARGSDIVGRLGGDEFGVILSATAPPDALRAAESYVGVVRHATLDHEGTRLRATASGGLVVVDGRERRSAEDLLADADVAMYGAKELGRDAVVLFDPTSVQVRSWRERFHALDLVQEALEEDRFRLYAQPILDLDSGRVTGFEVLVRLEHDGTLLGPAAFLPVAERHGLAPAIDRWVVRHALSAVRAAGVPSTLRWEINLSAGSLTDEGLLAEIEREMAVSALPPGTVVFEVTETAAIANMHQAQQFVDRASSLGCHFAMDDFGAGYGSFYYLKHLPFDYLKIDGEFVRDLVNEPHDAMIVSAIVTAARAMGKQTIAEYVQDAETLRRLHELGVDHAQGFHIGRPRPMATALQAN